MNNTLKNVMNVIEKNATGSELYLANDKLTLETSRKDIYIKKVNKERSCVIFKTSKAVKIAKDNNVPNHYEGEEYHKFDIAPNQAVKILTWAITHNLSVDTEEAMIVQPK